MKLTPEQGRAITAKLTELFEAEDFVCIVTDSNKRSVHVFNRVKSIPTLKCLRIAVVRWLKKGTSRSD